MKKIIFFLILGFTFQSCQKEVEDNTPAFQARVNNFFWKGTIMSGTEGLSGDLTLRAQSAMGSIVLKTTASTKGTYVLGTTNQDNKAFYTLIADGSKNFTTSISQNPVNLLRSSVGGTGYSAADLVETSTSGLGTGLKVGIEVNAGGAVTKAEIRAPGNGYKAGDLVTISGGNNNAKFVVANVANSNGEVKITKNDGVKISGTFKFTAFDAASGQTVVCREGFFYEVPLY